MRPSAKGRRSSSARRGSRTSRREWDDPHARAFYDAARRDPHASCASTGIGVGALGPRSAAPAGRRLRGAPRSKRSSTPSAAAAAVVFATSCAGLAAARLAGRRPEAVDRLVFFGALRDARRHPRGGAPLAPRLRPHELAAGRPDDRRTQGDPARAETRSPGSPATCAVPPSADVAAAFLELDLFADLRPYLPTLPMPALVLHRRDARAVPIGRGRELASLLPNARFVALAGGAHTPLGSTTPRDLQRALAGFLGGAPELQPRTAARR